MANAAAEVNRARADQKHMQEMQTVNDNLEGYPNGSILITGRSLIRAGPLIKLSPSGDRQERHFFLFSDMILYGVKKKQKYLYKDHIDLAELSVRSVSPTEKTKGNCVVLCRNRERSTAVCQG